MIRKFWEMGGHREFPPLGPSAAPHVRRERNKRLEDGWGRGAGDLFLLCHCLFIWITVWWVRPQRGWLQLHGGLLYSELRTGTFNLSLLPRHVVALHILWFPLGLSVSLMCPDRLGNTMSAETALVSAAAGGSLFRSSHSPACLWLPHT